MTDRQTDGLCPRQPFARLPEKMISQTRSVQPQAGQLERLKAVDWTAYMLAEKPASVRTSTAPPYSKAGQLLAYSAAASIVGASTTE